jgi:hypothetical protein
VTDANPTPEEPADGERSTGPLASCGHCTNGLAGVVLDFGCDVHGQLAEWLSANANPAVVRKVIESARNAERTNELLDSISAGLGECIDALRAALRPRD